MKLRLLISIFALMYLKTAIGDEAPIICDYSNIKVTKPIEAFSNLHEVSKSTGEIVCKNIFQITPAETSTIEKHVEKYTSMTSATIAQLYDKTLFAGLPERANIWADLVNANYTDAVYLSFMQSAEFDRNGDYIWQVFIKAYENGVPPLEYKLTLDHESSCQSALKGSLGCNVLFEKVSVAVNPFTALVKDKLLTDNGNKLAGLQKDWQDFIDNARYQTPLDVWATTLAYSDHYSGKGLSGPPPTQYFLLRPTLVYERIGDLPDGDQDEVSIAIEWFGMNFWKEGIGGSFISTYRDSRHTSDVGTGLMLHIDNTYSFGFTHRGKNENSVFLNIDILEWVGDKMDTYEKYKAKMFN